MQIWKHTRRAPTMSLSTKCAWTFRNAMSLMESAMNRNSPNMWDHIFIYQYLEERKTIKIYFRLGNCYLKVYECFKLTVSFVHQNIDSKQSFEGNIVRYPRRMKGLNWRYDGALEKLKYYYIYSYTIFNFIK